MRPVFIAVLCTWGALFVAAIYYSQQHPEDHWLWTAAFPALLLETLFYIGSVFENSRNAFAAAALSFRSKAALLWLSALLPYLVFSFASHTMLQNAFGLLAGLTAVFCFWFAVLPKRLAYDVGFLVVGALPLLSKLFVRLYRSPDPHIRVDILGHLMWIRVGIIALLVLREWDAGPVSLWPRSKEWQIGVLWFCVGIVPTWVLASVLHAASLKPVHGPWWRLIGIAFGTFVGYFCIMIGEELFFRGVIERAFLNLWRSPVPAILISAVCFGAVHLWFRHYPDWQWALVASVLGIACGFAYAQAGSIRASLVTHTMTIVAWRLFLT